MSEQIRIGCCGWSYLRPAEFSDFLTKPFSSTLQAYAQLFRTVEVNSTFYRIPRRSTAEKWRREADELGHGFEFTVKAFQGITHRDRFGKASHSETDALLDVADALSADILLFQSPASFLPSQQNILKMKSFFSNVERGRHVFVWEPRGSWSKSPQAIVDVCSAFDLVHCVDPLRDQPLSFGHSPIAYFRLHGFGRPSMYSYSFSVEELGRICEYIRSLPTSVHRVYIFFNNVTCYQDGRKFKEMLIAG